MPIPRHVGATCMRLNGSRHPLAAALVALAPPQSSTTPVAAVDWRTTA